MVTIPRFRPAVEPQSGDLQPLEPQEQPKPKRAAKKRPRIQPVRANRNFLNFPLARDIRTKAKWQWDAVAKNWQADLPGHNPRRDPRYNIIRLILPKDVHKKRCQTAIDINLRYYLLAQLQHDGKDRRVVLSSLTSVLPAVGLTVHSKNLAKLKDSLVYLMDLSLGYSRWYVRPKEYAERLLPPLIEKLDRKHNSSRIVITINQAWVKLALDKGYHFKMPLPLPSNTAAQNLVQLVLTQEIKESEWDYGANLTKPLDMRWVTRKIGLNHSKRNLRFPSVLAEAVDWFAVKNGGLLELIEGGTNEHPSVPPGTIALLWRLPTPRKSSKIKPTLTPPPCTETDTHATPPSGNNRH